jgi:RNA polymerase sigma-70 factor (ECF subfamily)
VSDESREPISDAAEWQRALSGDGRAFGILFDRHRDRVYRAALRRLSTPSDAEDAVAATFLELWRRRAHVRIVDDSVLPWLLTVAVNVTRNLNRYRHRHAAFLLRLPPSPQEPSAEEVAVDELERYERQAHASSLLHALPAADAKILELTLVEGLRIDAAADVLGISPQAARKRLSRARQRARTLSNARNAVAQSKEAQS